MAEGELVERVRKLEKQDRRLRQGAVLRAAFLGLVVFIGLSGCKSEQPKPDQSTGALSPAVVRPYQRFIPIAHNQGFLSFPYWAFDTKTGQLCKTWGWQSETAAFKKAEESGNYSKLTGIDAAAIGTPTCKELWKDYPDEVSLGSALNSKNPKKSGSR